MKKTYFTFILFSVAINTALSQEVISTSGDFFQSGSISLSQTIGETITESFTGTSTILTQGFQQSRLTTSSIYESENNSKISIAPNPTTDFITLSLSNYHNIFYELYDFNGKLLKKEKINSEDTKIFFNKYAYAAYFLKIIKGNKILKIFEIIKQ